MTKRIESRWPHRMAWATACTVFPLIWIGGLVTTYDAGMAVPDWPNTFGYNLFLYPLKSWFGIWDQFLEHGHRLIGATVGVLTIALAVLLWRCDGRKWIRWMGVAAVVGVCFQGLLGGFRVLGDERFLAKIHGCTAPLFFALCAALVTLTSRAWSDRGPAVEHPAAGRLHRLSLVCALGTYLQIVLGAQLRHMPTNTATGWFELWVWLHLIAAGLVLTLVISLLVVAARNFRDEAAILVRAWMLVISFSIQVFLGAGAWVTNYGFPAWFTDYIWPLGYTVVTEGPLQAAATTLHVGVGAMTLLTSVSVAIWTRRVVCPPASAGRARRE